MIFNSFVFCIFAAIFFLGWIVIARRSPNVRWLYLTVASYVFYGYWNYRFLLLLTFCGLANFTTALAIERWPDRKRIFLALDLLANLAPLALFKYADFAIATYDDLARLAGGQGAAPLLRLTLPIGISFYTFMGMSYVIDVYRGELRATRNVLHFMAFLSLFPHLVAGPILRASHLLPQLTVPQRARLWDGARLVVSGYFKKMVIADGLAGAVDALFASPGGSSHCWLAAMMFGAQIYTDFSGYTDIARGLGRFMGYDFGENFDHPYLATSMREFWQRWHISLSSWFRDYVYIPLGGSRRGPRRALLYMAITMLVSGLWHGAAWTYVVWGALHATFVVLERLTGWPARIARLPFGRHLCLALVLLQVLVTWVFFRAASVGQAGHMLATMFRFDFRDLRETLLTHQYECFLLLLLFARHAWVWRMSHRPRREIPTLRFLEPVFFGVVLAACLILRGPGRDFVYFQF